MKFSCFCVLILLPLSKAQDRAWAPEEETAEYWYKESEMELAEALKRETLNMNVARNVIMFLGDGMGIATVTAGRVMKGQLHGKSGEETVLAMDKLPHSGLSKTYSVDSDVSDSAVTATAYLCGAKGNYGTIGVSGKVERGDCEAVAGNEVNSILMDSFAAGKSTGIVTTAHLPHATPAGAYAHTCDRFFYADSDFTDGNGNYTKDIAQQFVDASGNITVAMGGGRKHFRPKDGTGSGIVDEEYGSYGERNDGQDLIKVWQDKHKDENAHYVWNQAGFDSIDPETTDRLLGVFETSHMQYETDRAGDTAGEPSLMEMTDKAIRILQKNEEGFFLLVESGRIDHAHHSNNAYRALTDFAMFDEAIQRAVELTAESDTLIVVTADHSHTMSMGGYSDRGNPITGLAPSNDDPEMALDGKPYSTLLYSTGPGYQGNGPGTGTRRIRENITGEITGQKDYKQQSAVPLYTATHAGEDVSIKASGPMAHLFHGIHEQSYIPYIMRYASCVGENRDHCNGGSNIEKEEEVKEEEIAAEFLGMELDYEHASIALYAQFFILLTIVFLICITCCKASAISKSGKSNASSFKVETNNAYETSMN